MIWNDDGNQRVTHDVNILPIPWKKSCRPGSSRSALTPSPPHHLVGWSLGWDLPGAARVFRSAKARAKSRTFSIDQIPNYDRRNEGWNWPSARFHAVAPIREIPAIHEPGRDPRIDEYTERGHEPGRTTPPPHAILRQVHGAAAKKTRSLARDYRMGPGERSQQPPLGRTL